MIDNIKKKFKTLEKLHGDAGHREYYRGRQAGSSVSLVICIDSNDESLKRTLEMQRLYKENEILVPEIYEFGQNYIIQQDLGKRHLAKDWGSESNDLHKILRVAKEISKISVDSLLKISGAKFDQSKYEYELSFFLKHYTKLFLINFSSEEKEVIESSFKDLSKKLSTSEKVVCVHRDFHGRNVMVSETKLYVIDFQDSMRGHEYYDLASMIEDPYSYMSENTKSNIIETYVEDFSEYSLVALQRLIKACGSFCYLYNEKNNPRYLRYISKTLERVFELSNVHKEFIAAGEILKRKYYEN